MTSTLGMPSLTPSNASGRSGLGNDQVGHIGKGILGTIEEGPAGSSSRQFYYGTGSAFYQALSVQRSYGDDIRSFNVKSFGARGMVNLPRRWLEIGPTEIFFTYPIQYAWAGPDYTCRFANKNLFNSGQVVGNNDWASGWSAAGVAPTGDNSAQMNRLLGELATEVRTGPNILPTYFWSGGVGFAFMSMIELNMGGGGNIIFDRYTNFAMIMASCPSIQIRRDLMRMAGGGLYYDYDTDFNTLPVKFGWVPTLTDDGTATNRDFGNSSSSDNKENSTMIWAPIEWEISVPIKTPQTNFWNALLSRKPIDTSCFASDLQYILSLGNFAEFSDTGTGLANCPYYIPPFGLAANAAGINADLQQAKPYYHPNQLEVYGASTWSAGVYTDNTQDRWIVNSTKPCVTLYNGVIALSTTCKNNFQIPSKLPQGWFYTGVSPQNDITSLTGWPPSSNQPILSTTVNSIIAASTGTPVGSTVSLQNFTPQNRIGAIPRIWTNHYRVCNGFIYGDYGAPRPKMAHPGNVSIKDSRYMKEVNSVQNGTPSNIQYASSFTRMEFRNRSIKLTNPALSARLPLQSAPSSCVYYPFAYGFSQTYRVPPASNPFDASNFHRWCTIQAIANQGSVYNSQPILSVLQDTLSVSNRISQNIIMPANPVTSMIVGIYREKDRKYLGINTQASYSPVLFWNALNPLKATLYDGGNILYDYAGPCQHEFNSLVNRPDILKIPFRGGLCQLDPRNIMPANWGQICGVGGAIDTPNGLGRTNPNKIRAPILAAYNTGERNIPLHCTEWYNCYLMEFPFVMNEPLSREGTVQSTPSFAKTILRLDFWIDPLLKPMRGLDDMYDITTQKPNAWYCGEWDYGSQAQGYSYNGTTALTQYSALSNTRGANGAYSPSCNVSLSVPNAYILDYPSNFNAYSDDRETKVLNSARALVQNPNATMAANASSWNINDGGLLIQVNFLQNQIWVISPLRTSILSSRG